MGEARSLPRCRDVDAGVVAPADDARPQDRRDVLLEGPRAQHALKPPLPPGWSMTLRTGGSSLHGQAGPWSEAARPVALQVTVEGPRGWALVTSPAPPA